MVQTLELKVGCLYETAAILFQRFMELGYDPLLVDFALKHVLAIVLANGESEVVPARPPYDVIIYLLLLYLDFASGVCVENTVRALRLL